MNSFNSGAGALYLGIDGGGSQCRALLADERGQLLGSGLAGPANPFQNRLQALASIEQASLQALTQAGLPAGALGQVVAGVGLAGVNVPRIFQQMLGWSHPFGEMHLTTDNHIACLGAHGGEDGAVVVLGTGSVGYVSVNGSSHSYGGYGFPFGDKGSGAWLGLEALKASLLYLDGLGPETQLLARIEAQLDVRGVDIVAAMAGARSRDYGQFAPLVLACAEEGDAVSVAIVTEAASYIDALVRRLLAHGARHFALLGGLGPRLTPWLAADVQAARVEAHGQPDWGALQFARTHSGTVAVSLG